MLPGSVNSPSTWMFCGFEASSATSRLLVL
jgi:hypothetical protein